MTIARESSRAFYCGDCAKSRRSPPGSVGIPPASGPQAHRCSSEPDARTSRIAPGAPLIPRRAPQDEHVSEAAVAMTSPLVPTRRFDHPAAWTAADLGGKDAFAVDLADHHIAAFETAVAGLRERGLTAFADIGRHDFPLDPIAEDVRAWRHEIADGRRLLLLREFPGGSMEPGGDGAGVVRPRHPLRPCGVAERARRPAGARGQRRRRRHAPPCVSQRAGASHAHRPLRHRRHVLPAPGEVRRRVRLRQCPGGARPHSRDQARASRIDLERLSPAPLRRAAARRAALHTDSDPGVFRTRRA